MATDLNAILSNGDTSPTPAPDPSPAQTDHERPVHVDEDGDRWEGGEGPGDDNDTGDKRPEPGPEVPPASDDDEDEDSNRSVPVKALREERRKRQELERRLAALENPQQQGNQDDPVRARLDLSVEYARDQYRDYEDAENAFVEAVKAHPRGRDIYEAMLKDKHPAKFAYTIGKQLMALDEIGDPTTFKQRILAERDSRSQRAPSDRPRPTDASPSLPPTLASSRDSGGRFATRDSKTATPLGEILAR
jgi:hypothetical protein